MPETKIDHCPLCSAFTTLYVIDVGDGTIRWGCDDGPGVTCHAMWTRIIETPPVFTIADF